MAWCSKDYFILSKIGLLHFWPYPRKRNDIRNEAAHYIIWIAAEYLVGNIIVTCGRPLSAFAHFAILLLLLAFHSHHMNVYEQVLFLLFDWSRIPHRIIDRTVYACERVYKYNTFSASDQISSWVSLFPLTQNANTQTKIKIKSQWEDTFREKLKAKRSHLPAVQNSHMIAVMIVGYQCERHTCTHRPSHRIRLHTASICFMNSVASVGMNPLEKKSKLNAHFFKTDHSLLQELQ